MAGLNRGRAFLAPLRSRDVRLMWFSDVFSVLGDYACVLALAVLTLQRTGSTAAVAAVSAAAFVPAFGPGPALATLADRWPYRRVMIACDVARGAAYLLIFAVDLPFPLLLVTVALAHCATFPFTAARGAQLPQIAGDDYAAAQSLSQATLQLGMLLGFAGGGVLLTTVGVRGALLLNVGSFTVSAVCVAAVSARLQTVSAGADEAEISTLGRMRSGARTLTSDPLLWWPALLVTVANAGTSAIEALAVVFAHTVLGGQVAHASSLAAVLAGSLAVSTLVAVSVAPSNGRPRNLVRSAAWMGLAAHTVAALALLGVSHGVSATVCAIVVFVVLGVSAAMMVPCVTVVGARLPANNRATTFALLESLLVGGQAVGVLLGGALATVLGVRWGALLVVLPGASVAAVCLLQLTGRRRTSARVALPVTHRQAPERLEA